MEQKCFIKTLHFVKIVHSIYTQARFNKRIVGMLLQKTKREWEYFIVQPQLIEINKEKP